MIDCSPKVVVIEITPGVRTLQILNDLKVHLTVKTKGQMSQDMCSFGILDIQWTHQHMNCSKLCTPLLFYFVRFIKAFIILI